MKEWFCAAIGVIGGYIASLFGGWSAALITLVTFMGVDYFTGLIVAGLFHASPKTPERALPEGGHTFNCADWKAP